MNRDPIWFCRWYTLPILAIALALYMAVLWIMEG